MMPTARPHGHQTGAELCEGCVELGIAFARTRLLRDTVAMRNGALILGVILGIVGEAIVRAFLG